MKQIYSFLMGAVVAIGGVATASAQSAKTVPYSSPIAVSSSAFDDGWTIIDNNNDSDGTYNMWGPVSDTNSTNTNPGKFAARYYNSSSKTNQANADDYLVSPAVHLEQGKDYKIVYTFRAESQSYPKSMKVFASKTNSAAAFSATQPIKSYVDYNEANYVQEAVTYTPTESGDYYFAFYTDSSNNGWYIFVSTFAVYEDVFTPAAVTDLKVERDAARDTKATLTWTLPTKSVFGDDFTPEQTVEKVNVYRDGATRPFAVLDGPATTVEDNVEKGLEPGIHTYEVEVEVAGAKSAKTSVTSKYIGPVTPATIPYTWEPSSQDAFDDWTVVKGPSAVTTAVWTYYDYYKVGRFSNEAGKKEENYLVAPPFNVSAPGYYLVTVNAALSNTSYNADNKYRVVYGTAPTAEALTNVACEKMDLTSSNKTPYSYVVKIDNPGTYYFAVEAAAEAPKSTYMYVYGIGLQVTEKTPAAVTNLKATEGADEAMEVTLTWTCPTQSSNGESMNADEYSIQVYRGSDLLTTLNGGTSTYADKAVPKAGTYVYTVKTVAQGGASVGGVNVTSKWVGPHLVDLPYNTTFGSADIYKDIWDIIDGNEDGYTWYYDSPSFKCAQPATAEEDGTYKYDDYFLTPYFELTPGYYKISFKLLGGMTTTPIKCNVGVVEAGKFVPHTTQLMQEQQFTAVGTSTSLDDKELMIKIDQAGRYQIVFAVNENNPKISSDYSYLRLYSFNMAAFPVVPAVATGLSVTAAEDELLEAYVSWTNPTATSVEGVALENITKAVIIRDGNAVGEVTENLIPGQTATFTDDASHGLTGGPHVYSVEIYNAAGKSTDAAPTFKLDWVGGGLEITADGVTHTYAEFEDMWEFVDVDKNQSSSYDGWSIAGTTAMKVDQTGTHGKYDDWAVSPRFNIKKGAEYELKFETYMGATYSRDIDSYTFDVYVGKGELDNFVKIGSVTSSDKNATASNPETHVINIKGADVANMIQTLDADADKAEPVDVPVGTLAVALRATQKGGVFVKTFSATMTAAPAPSLSFEDVEMEVTSNTTTAVTKTVDVALNAETPFKYQGFQFDVTLPEGVTVEGASSTLTESITTGEVSGKDNTYRVLAYLGSNEGTEQTGTIATLTLSTKWDADTEYPVYGTMSIVEPIVFSTVTGDDITGIDGYTGNLTITLKAIPAEEIVIGDVTLMEPSTSASKDDIDNITVGEGINIDLTLKPGNTTTSTEDIVWSSDDVEGLEFSYDEEGNLIVNTDGVEVDEPTEVTITGTVDGVSASYTFTINPVVLGDANDSGEVTVADVVTISNYIDKKPVTRFDYPNANVILTEEGGEQVINTSDLTATVDIAMGENADGINRNPIKRHTGTHNTNDRLVADNFKAVQGRQITIGVALDNSYDYAALHAEVVIPEGMKVTGVSKGERAAAHELDFNITDGRVYVTLYSFSNASFINGEGNLFNLTVVADENCEDISFDNINAADAASNGYYLYGEGGRNVAGTTGIDGIDADEEGTRYFDINGIEIPRPDKGIYIKVAPNGEAVKVVK